MSSYFKKIIQISLISLAFFSVASFVFAQQEVISNSMSSVNLTISPVSPRAGDSVTVTVNSDSLDLNSAKIVWYVDNVARNDTSNKSITINTKNNGDKTTVRVIVQTIDGIIKEATKDISPAGVDLVIEPMSYTMPFYLGKPYFAPQDKIKVIALPDIVTDGVKIASKDLTFKWIKDDSVLGPNSGLGKDTIIINSTIPVRDINISVRILDDSGNILAQASKIIAKDTPKILFYENNALYGILYNKAITDSYYLGTKEEFTVIAKPFSFDFLNDTPSQSSYTWYANNNPIDASGKANEIILRQSSSTPTVASTATISLDIKNTDKILQSASGSFDVQFGQ